MAGMCYEFAEKGRCKYGVSCKFSHKSGPKDKTKGKGKSKKKMAGTPPSPLEEFFARYPAFDYDSSAPSSQEFYRMCDTFGWDREDEERAEAHDDFKKALVEQFNTIYGTDVDNVTTWHGLCRALRISPLPNNAEQGKQIFRRKFVNLVDLVDTARTGERVIQFRTLDQLQEYTIEAGRFFPKDSAYAGGMLKYLLREILNKREGSSRTRQRRGN